MPARGQKPGHRGGRTHCLACHLPEPRQQQLNEELARGLPLYRLSKKYDINRESLRWHKQNHVTPALIALRTESIANGVRPALEQVDELIERDSAMYEAARAVANMPLALVANRLQGVHVELRAKLTGDLDERPQIAINIQATPEWVNIRSIIFMALDPFPELRHAISRALHQFAQWPDTDTAILSWEEIRQRLGPGSFPPEDEAS
jgi:hypothetical protein